MTKLPFIPAPIHLSGNIKIGEQEFPIDVTHQGVFLGDINALQPKLKATDFLFNTHKKLGIDKKKGLGLNHLNMDQPTCRSVLGLLGHQGKLFLQNGVGISPCGPSFLFTTEFSCFDTLYLRAAPTEFFDGTKRMDSTGWNQETAKELGDYLAVNLRKGSSPHQNPDDTDHNKMRLRFTMSPNHVADPELVWTVDEPGVGHVGSVLKMGETWYLKHYRGKYANNSVKLKNEDGSKMNVEDAKNAVIRFFDAVEIPFKEESNQ